MDIENQESKSELEIENNTELSRFAYFKEWVINCPVTALCTLISIILFSLVSYSTSFENLNYPENIREYLAYLKYGGVLDGPAQQYLKEGQLWRIFVNVFHHGNLLHIGSNLIALYFFGSIVEKFIGSFKYLIFIVFCGLCQAIICQLTIEKGAIGLSGVIYGMFGFLFIIRKKYPQINLLINNELAKAMFAQLFIFMFLTYFNLMNIANIGHVSGLIYGLLFALAFYMDSNILKKLGFIILNLVIISGLYYI